MTTANHTSFKAIATNSSATPFTNTHAYKITSFSFNVLATTFVAQLPQTLLPSFTVTNANDTHSEGVLYANNTPNNKASYLQQSLPRMIHGTTHSPPA
jgi:hypothetical protein